MNPYKGWRYFKCPLCKKHWKESSGYAKAPTFVKCSCNDYKELYPYKYEIDTTIDTKETIRVEI